VAVLARIGHCEPGDIVQEVYARVLERRRNWPKDMALGAFVVSAGRSIINAKVRHRKRSPYRDAESVNGRDGDLLHHGEDPHGSPEDQVILLDLLTRAENEIAALFEDDEAAAMIWLGRQDGLEGEPLRELTGLDKTEFASKRRLVQRRLISYRNEMEGRR